MGTVMAHVSTLALALVHAHSSSSGKLSNAAIAAAALAALIALICLAWSVARMLAFEPRWTLSLRHAHGRGRLPRVSHVG